MRRTPFSPRLTKSCCASLSFTCLPVFSTELDATKRCSFTKEIKCNFTNRLSRFFPGPAGTGKTESVKALGHQLGRFVLVFNCDETFDFQVGHVIFLLQCVGMQVLLGFMHCVFCSLYPAIVQIYWTSRRGFVRPSKPLTQLQLDFFHIHAFFIIPLQ